MTLYRFFFQAEDGIRDGHVTGVQTCALPIYRRLLSAAGFLSQEICGLTPGYTHLAELIPFQMRSHLWRPLKFQGYDRSEERRVGKKGRARRGDTEEKKKLKVEL